MLHVHIMKNLVNGGNVYSASLLNFLNTVSFQLASVRDEAKRDVNTLFISAVRTRPCAYFTDRGSVFRLENVCQALPAFILILLFVANINNTKGYKNNGCKVTHIK